VACSAFAASGYTAEYRCNATRPFPESPDTFVSECVALASCQHAWYTRRKLAKRCGRAKFNPNLGKYRFEFLKISSRFQSVHFWARKYNLENGRSGYFRNGRLVRSIFGVTRSSAEACESGTGHRRGRVSKVCSILGTKGKETQPLVIVPAD
jgi:hypothetical protein